LSLLQFDGASVTGADHSAWGTVIFGSLPSSADYAAVGGLPRLTLYESGVYKSGLSSLEAIYYGLADGLRAALQRGISALLLECDYKLLVLQLLDRALMRQLHLCKIRNDIILLIDKFNFVAIRHIYQRFNLVAKDLTSQAILAKANVSSCRQHDCLFKSPLYNNNQQLKQPIPLSSTTATLHYLTNLSLHFALISVRVSQYPSLNNFTILFSCITTLPSTSH
jgi:hypothetical protein